MQNPISLFRSLLQWFLPIRRGQSEQSLSNQSPTKEQAVEALSPDKFREMFAAMLADSETRKAIMRSLVNYFPIQGGACGSVNSSGAAMANSIAMFTAACNIESANIFQSSGNVGIGTTSPATPLHVVSSSISDIRTQAPT